MAVHVLPDDVLRAVIKKLPAEVCAIVPAPPSGHDTPLLVNELPGLPLCVAATVIVCRTNVKARLF